MSDAQGSIVVPFKVMAVSADLFLYLPPHGDIIITRFHLLPVGINKAGPSG